MKPVSVRVVVPQQSQALWVSSAVSTVNVMYGHHVSLSARGTQTDFRRYRTRSPARDRAGSARIPCDEWAQRVSGRRRHLLRRPSRLPCSEYIAMKSFALAILALAFTAPL